MVKKYGDLYLQARRALLPSEGENASMAARELLAFASGKSVTAVLADSNLYASEQIEEKLSNYVNRMLAHEPLPYILGQWDFYGISLEVTPDVLIPRDDTMAVTDLALDVLRGREAPRVLDLCCGSGAIGVSLAHFLPHAQVWASDISAAALEVAQANAAQNGVAERMHFLQGDLFAPFAGLPPFAAILANPPYIPSGEMPQLQAEVQREPALALDGGSDGLDYYRRLVPAAREYLQPGGLLFLETGYDQRESVASLLLASGYAVLQTITDYGQNHRGFVAQI